MALETANYISDLVETNPTPSDQKSQGDDHLRTIKKVIKQTINGFPGAALVTAADAGNESAHVLYPSTALLSYATNMCLLYVPTHSNLYSAVTVNVSGLGARSIKTMYGDNPQAGDIAAGVPLLLMYDGTNFVCLAGGDFLAKSGNQTLNGNFLVTGSLQSNTGMVSPTPLAGTSSNAVATTEFAMNMTSPAFYGTPQAPTATTGNSSFIVANTDFVSTAITNEANRATAADAVIAANVGAMLGINFGAFSLIDGELIVTHLTTSTPSLVDGDLILTYETL